MLDGLFGRIRADWVVEFQRSPPQRPLFLELFEDFLSFVVCVLLPPLCCPVSDTGDRPTHGSDAEAR